MDAFYDMALLSWAEKMTPPLPLLSQPRPPVDPNAPNCFEEARKRKGTHPQDFCDASFTDFDREQRTWTVLQRTRFPNTLVRTSLSSPSARLIDPMCHY